MSAVTQDCLTRRADMLAAMRACQQANGVSVLEHGRLVRRAYVRLCRAIEAGAAPDGWRLPAWCAEAMPAIVDEFDDRDVRLYQLFHDCGKPSVEQVIDGRRHFPGHARASHDTWLSIGGSELVARLMDMDMDAHLLKADGVEEFASRPEALLLLLTAVAEVHANATMFGGLDSDSFKMKAKHLDKRGRQVVAARVSNLSSPRI